MAPFRGPSFSQAPAWLPPWLVCSPLCSDSPGYETPSKFASSGKGSNFEDEHASHALMLSQPKPLVLQLSLSPKDAITDSNLNHEESLRSEQEQHISSVPQFELCKGSDVRLNLESEGNLESCLKRPVENHLSAIRSGKKIKMNNPKLGGENVQAAVGLTVASAETVLIADVMKSCPTCQNYGPTAILEAALKLKRGREMCGLDEFTLESVGCEGLCDDGWINDLDDLLLEEEYLNIGQLKLPQENLFDSAHIEPNIGARKPSESIEEALTSFGSGVNTDDLLMANNQDNRSFQGLEESQACIGAAVEGKEIVCVSPTSVHIPGMANPLSQGTFQCNQHQPLMVPKELFNSRWLGGWTGMNHEVGQHIEQNIIGIGKKKIFSEVETSNLSEPCELLPVDTIQRGSVKHHGKGCFSLLNARKENALKGEDDAGKALSAESCAEILMTMSQASARCSSSALQEPICSFVPCSIATNKASSPTEVAGSIDHGVGVARAMNGMGQVIESMESFEKGNGVATIESGGNFSHHYSISHQLCNESQIAEQKQDGFQAPFQISVTRRHLSSLKCFSTGPLGSLLEAVSFVQHLQSSPADIVTSKITNIDQNCLENQSGTKKTNELATDVISWLPNCIQLDKAIQNDVPNYFSNKVDSSDQRKDSFQDSDLQDSPPLTWHCGKRRRLRACRIVDSALIQDADAETLSSIFHNDYPLKSSSGIPQKDGKIDSKEMLPAILSPAPVATCLADKQMGTSLSTNLQKVMKCELRSSKVVESGNKNITNGAPDKLEGKSHPDYQHDVFKGLEFMLTGFSTEKKTLCDELRKKIEEHGGVVLLDVPMFTTFVRHKTGRLHQIMTRRPIIVAPQQVRTTKFLYGCAVGSLIVKPNWIDQCIIARTVMSAKNCIETRKHYQHVFLRCEEEGSKTLFNGLEVILHGQQDYCSKIASLIKHGGGQVLRSLNHLKHRKNVTAGSSIQVVVVEHQSSIPRRLKHSAASLKVPIVSGDWIVSSLLEGRLLALPALASNSRLVCAADPKVSSFSTVGANGLPPKKNISERNKVSIQKRKLCATSDWKKQSCTNLSITFLGKGTRRRPVCKFNFTFDFMSKYSEVNGSSSGSEKFLHYKAVSFKGITYAAGDIVEIQPYTDEEKEFYVGQIQSFYSDCLSSVKARFAKDDPERERGKMSYMCCRWFYRPSDTGFPCFDSNKELYASQHFDDNVPVQNIVKKVVVVLIADKKVFTNHNEMGWKTSAEGPSCSVDFADYACRFFYDHKNESLHQLTALLRS